MYFVLAGFFFVANMFFMSGLDRFDEMCKRFGSEMIALKLQALDINSMVLAPQFLNIAFVCIFFLPILTMRLIADEKKNRTIELLMTSPISSLEIILGKFAALNIIWLIILVLTFMYPFAIAQLPLVEVDWGYYMTGFLGVFLFGILGISIGIFASSVTDNLLIAAVIGFFIMGFLYFLINIALISDSPLGSYAYSLAMYPHLSDFTSGTIDSKNIVYFLLGTGFMIFVSERILESQRWR